MMANLMCREKMRPGGNSPPEETSYAIITRKYWKSVGTTGYIMIKQALTGIQGFDYL